MTIDVLKLQGDYKVQTQSGGTITLNVGNTGTTGTVIITGNLDVRGATTQIESVNATIKDATILLNQGDPATLGNEKVTLGLAGIQISRGNNDAAATSAYIQWNETDTWNIPSSPPVNQAGVFEFRLGTTLSPIIYSGIKINAIRIDESSAPLIDNNPRLSIFGSDNPNSVLSVAGAGDYHTRVTDPDDIPNKYYVDHVLSQSTGTSAGMRVGNSYVKLLDNYADGVPSELMLVLNGDPDQDLSVPNNNITGGTLAFSVTQDAVKFANVEFVNNVISTVGTNTNLILQANGTGVTVFTTPVIFGAAPPLTTSTVASEEVGLYGSTPGGGGTGMYYVNNTISGEVISDEFVSRKKALIYSLIF